jgi:D-arabinitol dehydrogenase (NADP+)
VEATGSEKICNDALDYVRRGGTLLVYGVYDDAARVHWSPARIFRDEITVSISFPLAPHTRCTFLQIKGSFAQTHCFNRAIAYIQSGKVKVKGMVTDVFELADYQKALDKLNERGALKICVKP